MSTMSHQQYHHAIQHIKLAMHSSAINSQEHGIYHILKINNRPLQGHTKSLILSFGNFQDFPAVIQEGLYTQWPQEKLDGIFQEFLDTWLISEHFQVSFVPLFPGFFRTQIKLNNQTSVNLQWALSHSRFMMTMTITVNNNKPVNTWYIKPKKTSFASHVKSFSPRNRPVLSVEWQNWRLHVANSLWW